MVLKKLALLFILALSLSSAFAQGDSYNFTRYGLAVSAGVNYPFADLRQANVGRSFAVAGYYNLTPYIPIGLEVQFGGISGGSIVNDPHRRQYNNHYKALVLHGDIGLGEIMDYDGNFFLHAVKDFYVGTGVGLISNNMAFVQRTNLIGSTELPVGSYTFPGPDKSINLMVPIRLGYEFKIYSSYGEPFINFNIGYIHNLTWGEGLDGYNDPSSGFKNNAQDIYGQFMIGLKINFGTSNPYYKAIN